MLSIAIRALVHKLDQKTIAEELGIAPATITRFFQGENTVAIDRSEKLQAFTDDYPVVDALVPAAFLDESFTITGYDAKMAKTFMMICKNALRSPQISETERLITLRNSVLAAIHAGSVYEAPDLDEPVEHWRLTIDESKLDLALTDLRSLGQMTLVPGVNRPAFDAAIEYNTLAVHMLIEAGRGGIDLMSPTISGLDGLLKRALSECASKDPANAQSGIVWLTMAIYAAAALSEMLLSAGDNDAPRNAVDKLQGVFGAEKRNVVIIAMRELAWEHNRHAYDALLPTSRK